MDKKIKRKYRSPKTGEDIDMLHEREMERRDYKSSSTKYKDHIDGA